MIQGLKQDPEDRLAALIQRQVALQYPKKEETPHQKAYRDLLPKSEGEELFYFQWKSYADLPLPEREQELVPGRNWRTDFVWRPKSLAVEIEGGVFTRGRHVRGKGFTDDIRKYREIENRGFLVLRFTTAMVKNWEAFNETIRVYNTMP